MADAPESTESSQARRAALIVIVWTAIVVGAGLLLVLFGDALPAVF